MKQIQLTALDSNDQIVRISLVGHGVESNGLDVEISVFMPAIQFTLRTFCFGYNLASFSSELELIEAGERQTANLFNYDESLVISLSQTTDKPHVRYGFLSYQVPNPHPPINVDQIPLDSSVMAFARAGGTHVSISFLKVHEHPAEIAATIDELIVNARIGTECPNAGSN